MQQFYHQNRATIFFLFCFFSLLTGFSHFVKRCLIGGMFCNFHLNHHKSVCAQLTISGQICCDTLMTQFTTLAPFALPLPPGMNEGKRRMWRGLQMEGDKAGMNKAMIEVIPSSHLQIGNPQAISYFHNVYRTRSAHARVFYLPLS